MDFSLFFLLRLLVVIFFSEITSEVVTPAYFLDMCMAVSDMINLNAFCSHTSIV